MAEMSFFSDAAAITLSVAEVLDGRPQTLAASILSSFSNAGFDIF
jgi:hypothetical protein